ncbi:histidine phosphatase family protein [Paenibacillus sp.]|jgi:alpha-ribazole phosphatase|uniref:histidine phosphatase family protein n=1 Tax=Paenibacillus sp. TaxID=58172 RepID=UPI0028327200|nr:histidine phosphatase family protein [Paenibacillus sp.]MDR0269805.1 histidine phosphatase family protein [Paenibacillus sp.]
MDLKRFDLVLMRHGSTLWNEQKRYLGHTDLSLSSKGHEELISARNKLKEMDFDRIYCSDLTRCRESLNAVRPDLSTEAVYDSRLREMDFGEWEGHTYDQLKNVPLYRQWLDEPKCVTPPQGESWEAFEHRTTEFLEFMLRIAEDEQAVDSPLTSSVLLVAHGGVIRQIVHWLHRDIAFWDIKVEPGNLLVLQMIRGEDDWTGGDLHII